MPNTNLLVISLPQVANYVKLWSLADGPEGVRSQTAQCTAGYGAPGRKGNFLFTFCAGSLPQLLEYVEQAAVAGPVCLVSPGRPKRPPQASFAKLIGVNRDYDPARPEWSGRGANPAR